MLLLPDLTSSLSPSGDRKFKLQAQGFAVGLFLNNVVEVEFAHTKQKLSLAGQD